MEIRYEWSGFPVTQSYRIAHISDVHFSARTTHGSNLSVSDQIIEKLGMLHTVVPGAPEKSQPLRAVCITGDLVSRKVTQTALDDAVLLLHRIRAAVPDAEVLYSLGNHEMDLPEPVRRGFLDRCREEGVRVLDNAQYTADGICFAGLTLPGEVFRLPNGSYFGLPPVTRDMVRDCIGTCGQHPCILLAHTPLGFPAYAAWGADLVLAGHVHGGVVRIGGTGLLSPERRFLPKYTKGVFREQGCMMQVSAGIGKFRVNNPAEIVCIDLRPQEVNA